MVLVTKAKHVVINTVSKVGLPTVNTIYHLDILLESKDVVEVACPTVEIIRQVNELRPNYNVSYKIA